MIALLYDDLINQKEAVMHETETDFIFPNVVETARTFDAMPRGRLADDVRVKQGSQLAWKDRLIKCPTAM